MIRASTHIVRRNFHLHIFIVATLCQYRRLKGIIDSHLVFRQRVTRPCEKNGIFAPGKKDVGLEHDRHMGIVSM
jgi:hypothetical protein